MHCNSSLGNLLTGFFYYLTTTFVILSTPAFSASLFDETSKDADLRMTCAGIYVTTIYEIKGSNVYLPEVNRKMQIVEADDDGKRFIFKNYYLDGELSMLDFKRKRYYKSYKYGNYDECY